MNRIEVNLDFSKPDLLDPNPLVSSETPNNSEVKINVRDITYCRAVQRVIETRLTNRRTWYSAIHRNFSYDFGMWVVALPIALFLATYYMDKLLPVGGQLGSYRWAFFIYATGLILMAYRFISGYAKWAFPVNVLAENKDTALKHRLALGAGLTWIVYKIVDVGYGLMFPNL
jgi:hypothetical protein